MKKTAKIIAVIVAIALILGLLFVANAFVGNPISKFLVKRNSDNYLEQNYSELNLQSEIGFSFKTNSYFVRVYSDTVEDLHFTLYYSMTGKLGRDTYENNITNGWNVLTRINEDYRHETDLLFEQLKNNPIFLNSPSFFGSGYLMSTTESEDREVGSEDNGGGIDGTTLELGKNYDSKQLGKIGGVLDVSVRFADGDESYERGAKALKEIKSLFDQAEVGFRYIHFGVFNEEGNFAYGVDFLQYNELDSEDLAEKLQLAHETNPLPYDK